jgi:hypothetical protein
MQNINKKGLAESIATFVLILVAVGAVTLAGWNLMKIFTVGDIQSSPTFNCLEETTSFSGPSIKIISACLSPNNELKVTLQRNSKESSISSISFLVEQETWTCSSETCGSGCEILEAGTSKTYYLILEQTPLDKNLEFYVGSCLIDEMKIGNC